MIYLENVKDWLKNFGLFEHYYVGTLNGKLDNSLGVYQRRTSLVTVRAAGNFSTYEVKPVSLLVHGTQNSVETEKAAFELYKKLEAVDSISLNNTQIYMLSLLQAEPINVGTDEAGIFEYVIEFDIYYERTK